MERQPFENERNGLKEVLVDTSVWVDFLNGKSNPQSELLSEIIAGDIITFICPQILQEILQGIIDDRDYKILRGKLLSLNMMSLDPLEAALGASELFRSLRKKGITIRKTNDILIAYYCIYYHIPILHRDRDFDQIAKYTSLKLFK